MIKLISFLLLMPALFSCKKTHTNNNNSVVQASPSFAKGADISWVTQMEASGYKFYDSTGKETDCFQLMKNIGMTAIRLRIWVNPAGGWCDSADVLAKAKRANNLGLNILLDFHYSDSWADPGKQNKPAAWATMTTAALINEVYSYTYGVLTYLKTNDIVPQWVQVGNEVTNGMLWPDGSAETGMSNFAQMISSGYAAVKAVDSSAKVVVHLDNGYNNATYRWIFDSLTYYKAKWDIIGMSLYPTTANWPSLDSQCLANMNDMVSRYNTQVMICEAGMEEDAPAVCRDFLTDIIAKVKSVNGSNGLGVFYWEPESYNWQGYTLGAFDNTGKPTVALNAFAN